MAEFKFDYYGKEESINVTGFAEHIGMHFEEIRDGYCRLTAEVNETSENGIGIAHGGFIASLMDSASGMSALFCNGKVNHVVTLNCSISYLNPALPGKVTCVGEIIKAGSRVLVSKATLFSDKETIAIGTFTFISSTVNANK